jgi:S-DNA-T family DNA segregation ATPase FtsK/SpoIIIE
MTQQPMQQPTNQQMNHQPMTDEQLEIVAKLTVKLNELRYEIKFIPPISVGPVISVYRFLPLGQTRVSQLEGLATDFAVLLGVEDVFVKRLPGEACVGVFVPNKERTKVTFLDTINNVWAVKDVQKIPLNLGVDHLGKPLVVDLCDLPHLLVAGSTGSGKSTLLSSLLASIIYCISPERVQFILSDTKAVEFGHFIGAPHLLYEPATTVYQTLERLEYVIDEMEDRLKILSKLGFRNIHEYNKQPSKGPLPFLVIVIDELADLMMFKGEKRGETKIATEKIGTIVQKSRAAGIYFIAGTQRPSVNIVAGSIKANFPARLTFRLPSEIDSRTVIGTTGAEHLLSQGDMLFVNPNRPAVQRVHAPYATITDIKAAVEAASHKGHN